MSVSTSKKVEMHLSQAHEFITSLRDLISGLRDQFEMFEARAKEVSQIVMNNYKADNQRTRRRKKTSRRVAST